MNAIQVVAVIEASTVTGPAKNLIRFCRLARAAADQRLAANVSLVTFHRGQGERQSDPFLQAAEAAGIPVEVIRERFRFDPSAMRQLGEIVRRRAPDIVQTHSVKSHFLMRLSGLWREHRWIAFHHGYTFDDLKMRAYNQLDRWSLPAAARVVTVCGPFGDALARAGVARDRIRVLPNSIEPGPAASAGQVAALRQRLAIREDERVILSVGRFSREKAHADLIRAAAHLARLHPELAFRVVLAGDGPEREKMKQTAASEGVAERVVFAGQQQEISPYYGVADLFVLPSHSEGSPNVILEAMAAGVPIAATAVGGVPEMVQDEESALLVRANDPQALAVAMGRLLTGGALASRLAGHAAATVRERFSPESHLRGLVKVYAECLEQVRLQDG